MVVNKMAVILVLCATTFSVSVCTELQAQDYCQSLTVQSINHGESNFVEFIGEDLPILTEKQVLNATKTGVEVGFGRKMSIDGSTLAVGSSYSQNDHRGFVDIFYLQNDQWQHIKTLKSPIEQPREYFRGVALDGDTLLVGAHGYCQSDPPEECQQGLVYIYDRNEGGPDNWGLVQQLDGGFKDASGFGLPLALSENTAAIMARREVVPGSENTGVVYIFEKDFFETGQWGLVKRLESSDGMNLQQGYSGDGLKIRGDVLLIYGQDQSGEVINEFSRNEGGNDNWGLAEQILFPATQLRASAYDGETLVVHTLDQCIPDEDQKHYLVFYNKDSKDGWIEQQKLEVDETLGSPAIEGRQVVVGSEDGVAGYLLQRESAADSWEFSHKLMASDPSLELYRSRTFMDSGRAMIGWPYDKNRDGIILYFETAPPINSGHSGAWFYPATSGQGQLLDVQPDTNFMFLSWFTYTETESDSPKQQHWHTAQGYYSGNTAELTLFETLGGEFDSQQEVSTSPVGEVTLSFKDCSSGQLSYRFNNEERQGSFPLQRVVPGSNNLCEEISGSLEAQKEDQSVIQAVNINLGMDGSWYEPDTSGQGFFIDVHTNTEDSKFIFVSWFTYGDNTASGQRWLTAQGEFSGSQASIPV